MPVAVLPVPRMGIGQTMTRATDDDVDCDERMKPDDRAADTAEHLFAAGGIWRDNELPQLKLGGRTCFPRTLWRCCEPG